MQNIDSTKKTRKTAPDFFRETELTVEGFRHIAGVDEAGRGPLAGPVVVAAVILNPLTIPQGLNDSKKLSAKRRDQLFTQILNVASVAIVSAPPAIIERLNIRGATLWAMARAVKGLPVIPDFALIDGRDVPENIFCEAEALIKGDARSISIAAASIVAKVARDKMCVTLDSIAPQYGFASHKGYGTAIHMAALEQNGATPHHRALFAPVAKAIVHASEQANEHAKLNKPSGSKSLQP